MSQGEKGEAHAPLKLPDWWPEATGSIRFPTDDSLPSWARALRGHFDALDMAMRDIAGDGLVTAAELGNWDLGQVLAEVAKSTHQSIGDVYREFQTQLEVVARLLVASHEGHDNVEQANTRDTQRVGGEIPDTPAASPTRQSTPSID